MAQAYESKISTWDIEILGYEMVKMAATPTDVCDGVEEDELWHH